MDEENCRKLVEIYKTLPLEIQSAMLWLMDHMEVVDCLVQGEKAPVKEIENLIHKAIDKDNYLMVVILVYKRIFDMNT